MSSEEAKTRTEILDELFQELRNTKGLISDMRRTMHHPTEHRRINRAQLEVFITIARARKPMTMKELAEIRHITPGGATQLVDALVEHGMLERHQSEDDRRSFTVTPTSHARHRMFMFKRFYASRLTPLFDKLSDSEIQTLIGLLRKLH